MQLQRKGFSLLKFSKKFYNNATPMVDTKIEFSLREMVVSLQTTLKENNKELDRKIEKLESRLMENNKELNGRMTENSKELDGTFSKMETNLGEKISKVEINLDSKLSEKMKTNKYEVVVFVCIGISGIIAWRASF
jgi:predicted nuclease with TOPRIM domain